MGRQIAFYMADSDESAFLEFVGTTGDVRLFQNCSASQPFDAEIVSFADLRPSPRDGARPNCYLWNGRLSPPPLRRSGRDERDCIDFFESEVVEFSPTFELNGGLQPGRIWMDPAHVENGQVAWKSDGFIRWYERLARHIRKMCAYDRDLRTYVAPGAAILRAQGKELR